MHCTPDQQAKLDELLAKNKDMFVDDHDVLSYTKTVKQDIHHRWYPCKSALSSNTPWSVPRSKITHPETHKSRHHSKEPQSLILPNYNWFLLTVVVWTCSLTRKSLAVFYHFKWVEDVRNFNCSHNAVSYSYTSSPLPVVGSDHFQDFSEEMPLHDG